MVETRAKFGYREYQLLPEDKRYEVIDGELLMSPAPTPYHQRVLRRLSSIVVPFVESRKLGEVLFAPCDVVLSEHDVVQPDLLFISSARLGIIGPKAIQGSPDLVAEVYAEPSAYRDLVLKKTLYAVHRIPEYWLVDIHLKQIEVLALKGAAYESKGVVKDVQPAQSAAIPGLEVRPGEIF